MVFFYLYKVAKKSLSSDTLPKSALKTRFCHTRTDEKTNSDMKSEFAFFFSHVFFFKFYENNKRFIGGMKENARVVFWQF